MKLKNIKTILLLSLFLILLSSFVLSANTVTLDAPKANGDMTGSSFTLNASIDSIASNRQNSTNVTFYYVDGPGNTTWAFACVDVNKSENGLEFGCTFDTTGESDGETFIFNATFFNMSHDPTTAFITEDTSTSVDIDNNAPSGVALPVDNTILNVLGPLEYVCTVTDAGDSATNIDLILEHPDGSRTVQTSDNDTDNIFIASFESDATQQKGENTAICFAEDDAGLGTNSSSITINIKSSDKELPPRTRDGGGIFGEDSSGILLGVILLGVILVVVIVVIILMNLKKGGKKKRRK